MTEKQKPRAAAVPWHHLPVEETLRRLETGTDGLSPSEAARRLAEHGPNRLPAPAGRSALLRLLAQFHNLLIYVLLGAAALSALLDHWVDTYVILAVVAVNALIGFIQEGRAEQALAAIRHMLSPRASVSRGGRRLTIDAEALVPGDLVLLEPGDRVPADLRLVRVKGLRIQEALLTGESEAVEKETTLMAKDADLGDRRCMAYSATLVSGGQGLGVVVATGPATEIGRISGLIGEVESLTTPLLAQMARFARHLTAVIVALAALVFAYGWLLQEQPATALFMTVIGLMVAAIPEGLPAILTVTLAIGVQRMAGRNAIIRRLPAVETLGAVSIICSDKTGTLTRNEMTVRSVAAPGAELAVSGVGYDPHGGFTPPGAGELAKLPAEVMELARGALLCNDAGVEQRDGEWMVDGDPMEGALVVLAMKAGLQPQTVCGEWPRTDVIPFDSRHKFMATLHHDHAGHGMVYLKGAPEHLLRMCSSQQAATGEQPLEREAWEARMEAIAARGERVLALARRPAAADRHELAFVDVEDGLTLLGLVGLQDPPREEAIQAVRECRRAGIRVKMITGDHTGTARAIADQLGLENSAEAVTGHQIEETDDAEMVAIARRVDVFARTTPEHKLRLVQALQAQGLVVAMTGDGVNDAPALKRADVGIAMGRSGTETAKEAAEMVLADDNFASIVQAVREGRTVYDNLKKAILFLLPVNGGESLSIMAALLAGLTLPITPLQILWVNMVSSVGLAMALAFEPSEPNAMQRPPRPRSESMLSGFLVWRITLVSMLFLAGIFGIFAWSQHQGATLEEARTYAVNTLVVMEIFYLFNVRYLGQASLTLQGLRGTRAVLAAVGVVAGLQLLFTYAPFMEAWFDTRPVDFVHGLEIIGAGVVLFLILELEKWVRSRLPLGAGRSHRGE